MPPPGDPILGIKLTLSINASPVLLLSTMLDMMSMLDVISTPISMDLMPHLSKGIEAPTSLFMDFQTILQQVIPSELKLLSF